MSTTTNNTTLNSILNCYEQLQTQERNARDYFVNYITNVVKKQYKGSLEHFDGFITIEFNYLVSLFVTTDRVLLFKCKGDKTYMSINLPTGKLFEIAEYISSKYDKFAED